MPESFTEEQKRILQRFVTSVDSNVFCLRNLPEVIKGALFSRYSRSTMGLRSLLLKEFIQNEETAFRTIVGEGEEKLGSGEQVVAIRRAQNFYDRILDGYGDDSIGEMGGAHLALEGISQIAAKEIEHNRIGGSPLEKSTRYVYFDQRIEGEFRFYREPILMTSAYRDLYLETCNNLFVAYGELIPPLTERMEALHPPTGEELSKAAYRAAIRAKVLDCLRGILPASTSTNMGIYGNGRFFEALLQKLNCHNLKECQEIGKKGFEELSKIIPSFVRRAEVGHRHNESYAEYREALNGELASLIEKHESQIPVEKERNQGVRLLESDPEAPARVGAALLFSGTEYSYSDLVAYCRNLPEEELNRILEVGHEARQNRRHKAPRAFEHAHFTFEIISDFGVYRDLQRHRLLTQERQLLGPSFGYYFPAEIDEVGKGEFYIQKMERAREAYETISTSFPEEAQYILPMAYHLRYYFHVSLRELQWICELRSAPSGHPTYRVIAQEMARLVSQAYPAFASIFKFVDYEGHELGRLGQEERAHRKKQARLEGGMSVEPPAGGDLS